MAYALLDKHENHGCKAVLVLLCGVSKGKEVEAITDYAHLSLAPSVNLSRLSPLSALLNEECEDLSDVEEGTFLCDERLGPGFVCLCFAVTEADLDTLVNTSDAC